MKFSIVLDNYNYGRFLKESIDSVLNQTHQDFELIIVDDGSTDDSRSIVAGYRDRRIVPILKENGGQGSAFKAGIARATGDYIAFLDSDDFWDPNKLQRTAEVLLRESNIVLLNHGYRELDDKPGSNTWTPPSGVYDFKRDLRRHSTKLSLVPTSFFIGRRQECKQLQFEDHQWRIAADTPVIIGLALRGKIYNLGEILGTYRIHGSNLWSGRFSYENGEKLGQPGVLDSTARMYLHYQRVYQTANDEQARLRQSERFDFSKTDVALSYHVLRTNRYSPQGIYWRLLKTFRRAAQENVS
jgi:glycosyltransferase involved in cell wall biosynthesis